MERMKLTITDTLLCRSNYSLKSSVQFNFWLYGLSCIQSSPYKETQNLSHVNHSAPDFPVVFFEEEDDKWWIPQQMINTTVFLWKFFFAMIALQIFLWSIHPPPLLYAIINFTCAHIIIIIFMFFIFSENFGAFIVLILKNYK